MSSNEAVLDYTPSAEELEELYAQSGLAPGQTPDVVFTDYSLLREIDVEDQKAGLVDRIFKSKFGRRVLAPAALALGLSGCMPTPAAPVGEGETVLAIGDSLTASASQGPGANNGSNPNLLIADLVEAKFAASSSSRIGATTGEIAGIDRTNVPNVDILLIGLLTNDARTNSETGEPSVPLSQYQENLEEFIDAVGPDCVGVIGSREVETWGHMPQVSDYHDYLNAEMEERDGVFVDHNDIAVPEYMSQDGIHFAFAPGEVDSPGASLYRDEYVAAARACKEKIDNGDSGLTIIDSSNIDYYTGDEESPAEQVLSWVG